MARTLRLRAALLTLPMLGGCGGNAPGPIADPGPRMSTFTGQTRISSNGVCSSLSPSNEISAGAGTVTVTLIQAGAPRLALQVCATTEANHTNCTVPPFASLALGQSVSAVLKGGRTQLVTLYPENCGGPNSPPGDPISYTVVVVYPG